MAGVATGQRFDMGRVFRNGLAVFNRFPVTLLAIGALFTFPTVIAAGWVNVHLVGPRPPSDDLAATWRRLGLLESVGVLMSGIGWLRVAAVGLCAGAAERDEARLDYLALVRRLLANLPVLYALAIVTTLATALGLVLLIVPGLIIGLAWSLAPIVAVREEKGLLSVLDRSAQLTRGHRIQLFAIFAVVAVVGGAIGLLARFAFGVPLLSSQLSDDPAFNYVVQPTLSAVVDPIFAAITAAAYTELRRIKEGATLDQIAQAFS